MFCVTTAATSPRRSSSASAWCAAFGCASLSTSSRSGTPAHGEEPCDRDDQGGRGERRGEDPPVALAERALGELELAIEALRRKRGAVDSRVVRQRQPREFVVWRAYAARAVVEG